MKKKDINIIMAAVTVLVMFKTMINRAFNEEAADEFEEEEVEDEKDEKDEQDEQGEEEEVECVAECKVIRVGNGGEDEDEEEEDDDVDLTLSSL